MSHIVLPRWNNPNVSICIPPGDLIAFGRPLHYVAAIVELDPVEPDPNSAANIENWYDWLNVEAKFVPIVNGRAQDDQEVDGGGFVQQYTHVEASVGGDAATTGEDAATAGDNGGGGAPKRWLYVVLGRLEPKQFHPYFLLRIKCRRWVENEPWTVQAESGVVECRRGITGPRPVPVRSKFVCPPFRSVFFCGSLC